MGLVGSRIGMVLNGPLYVLNTRRTAPGLTQSCLSHLLALHLHGLERHHFLLVRVQLLLLQVTFLPELHSLQSGVGPNLSIQFTFQCPLVLILLDFVLRPRRLRQLGKIVCTRSFNKCIAIYPTSLLIPFHLLPDELLVLAAQAPALRNVVALLLQASFDMGFPLLTLLDGFNCFALHFRNVPLQGLLISPLLPSLGTRLELFTCPTCHGTF
mmetsp:Transcript_4616/g.10155  ORF Transcript_4616/g.10155 Transcript_4616/m.10155 type:complete len:212 (+) Transcript_4616:449-1084(+)